MMFQAKLHAIFRAAFYVSLQRGTYLWDDAGIVPYEGQFLFSKKFGFSVFL